MNEIPPEIAKAVNSSIHQIRDVITHLRHNERNLTDLVNIATEFEERSVRLGFIVHCHDLDDMIGKLQAVKFWLSEAQNKL